MTDRELLEKAAKAAGMQHMRWSGPLGMVRMLDPSRPESTGSIGDYWNPLEDDGDALRLLTALRLEIKFLEGFKQVVCRRDEDRENFAIHGIAGYGQGAGPEPTDENIRRAIVLAAAAMGGEV
ncbi:hypothetical protein DFO67_10438 [Modicisalibacter xianhensis]|uniref:Phage ABA sandwich domain-containing protein n=1 Tax=Modicisalibacter xianhensis TaxID=442341 RepID=A0A4R8G2V3_9GAMM|nr:hypothetical protein [Halomonas xianhensis]TDX30783.1 hypothetical protein DFO67_10438 [Halomonas xianhensis]